MIFPHILINAMETFKKHKLKAIKKIILYSFLFSIMNFRFQILFVKKNKLILIKLKIFLKIICQN